MSGFDRIKPPEQRLLEREDSRQPDSRQADAAGRAGLFSASEEPTTPGAGVRSGQGRGPARDRVRDRGLPRAEPKTAPIGGPRPDREADGPTPPRPLPPDVADSSSVVQVACQHCGVTCPMPLTGALKRVLPMAVLAPWRSHPVFATCPCGDRRAWLKPTVGLPR